MLASNRAWALAIVFGLLVAVVLQIVGGPLTTAAAPVGIVSFEFAGDVDGAQAIMASWNAVARLRAAFSLGLDYVFMGAYAAAISLTCARASGAWRRRAPAVAQLGLLLAGAQWVAATVDAVENVALLRLLLGAEAALWPTLAWWCAAIKFALVAGGLLYALSGGLVWLLPRGNGERDPRTP